MRTAKRGGPRAGYSDRAGAVEVGCDGGGDGVGGRIGKPWGRGGAVGKKSGAMGKNSIGGTPSFMAANSDANALMEAFMNKQFRTYGYRMICLYGYYDVEGNLQTAL